MDTSAVQPQRQWIAIGMAECCAARGYERTSVVDICAAAGVTESAFAEVFADKAECLGAAMELLAEKAWPRLDDVARSSTGWPSGLRAGVATLLDLLSEHPALAHVALVDAPAAPGRAPVLLDSCRAALLEFLDRGRVHAAADIPASAASGALAGAETLLRGRVLAGEAKRVTELTPEVVYMLAVPFLGVHEAQRLAAEPGRGRLRAVA